MVSFRHNVSNQFNYYYYNSQFIRIFCQDIFKVVCCRFVVCGKGLSVDFIKSFLKEKDFIYEPSFQYRLIAFSQNCVTASQKLPIFIIFHNISKPSMSQIGDSTADYEAFLPTIQNLL